MFDGISEEMLAKKVRQLIEYSLHDEYVSRFRRMMTIEQFRNAEFAAMYSERYPERLVRYHAGLFRALIKSETIPIRWHLSMLRLLCLWLKFATDSQKGKRSV